MHHLCQVTFYQRAAQHRRILCTLLARSFHGNVVIVYTLSVLGADEQCKVANLVYSSSECVFDPNFCHMVDRVFYNSSFSIHLLFICVDLAIDNVSFQTLD